MTASPEDLAPVSADGRVAGTQAIARAFAVLHLFRDRGTDLGVVQVAKELGLTLSTAHRLIRALVAEGYLAQNEETDRYYLSTAAFLLGQSAQRNLGLDAARPVLERLSTQTGETVNLGILDGESVVIAQRVESPLPLRFSQAPGTRVSLYASSTGKAVLAFNDDLAGYLGALGRRLPPLTRKTHRTLAALRQDLEHIRDRGWSTDDEETILGVRCVGAPVLDSLGRARAAVAVQAPAVRMPESRLAELGPDVVRAAKEISTLLPAGHRI